MTTTTPLAGQDLVRAAVKFPYSAPLGGAVHGCLDMITHRTGWTRGEIRWEGLLPIEKNRLRDLLNR